MHVATRHAPRQLTAFMQPANRHNRLHATGYPPYMVRLTAFMQLATRHTWFG
jgi:hypothetical protein